MHTNLTKSYLEEARIKTKKTLKSNQLLTKEASYINHKLLSYLTFYGNIIVKKHSIMKEGD